MRRTFLRTITVAAIILGTLQFTIPARADFPLGVSNVFPARGESVRTTGAGCSPNQQVTILYETFVLRRANADNNGAFKIWVRIPKTASLGSHILRAYCLQPYPPGSRRHFARTINVQPDSLFVSDGTPARGQVVTVAERAGACNARTKVSVRFEENPIIGTGTSAADGGFRFGVKIPTTAHTGFATLRAFCKKGSGFASYFARVNIH